MWKFQTIIVNIGKYLDYNTINKQFHRKGCCNFVHNNIEQGSALEALISDATT